MPAVRFSASPPPRAPPPPPGASSSEAASPQPVRSALAHPEPSLEATFGLIIQSQDRRFGEQDALPPRPIGQPPAPHSASDLTLLRRRSNPPRPARPTSAALQGAHAYLEATVKPSTMRLKDVEAWVEDSLHAQEGYGITPSSPLDTSATSTRSWPTKPESGEWPSLDHTYAIQEGITELEGEPLQRTKSSSFSSSTRKKLAKSPSDLVNWFKSPSLPGSGPRSRSTSQTTEPSEEEQAAAFDQRWSTSSRRRLLRLSDSSQRALLTSGTPPTYRSVLNGFHRRFYSTSGNSESSDSSWTSFGCIDGMRRSGAGMKAAKNVDKNKIDECDEQDMQSSYPANDTGSMKDTDPEKADHTVKDDCSIKEASPDKKASQVKEANPVKDANSAGKASVAKKAGQAKESRPVKEALKRFASRLEVPIRPPRQYLESDTSCMMPYY